MNKICYLLVLTCLFSTVRLHANEKEYITESPDKTIKLKIATGKSIVLQVFDNSEMLFEVKNIYMQTDKGFIPSADSRIVFVKKTNADSIIVPVIREKTDRISDRYNEIVLGFKDKTKLQCRVYDNGVAYRLISSLKVPLTVNRENAEFIFEPASEITYQQDRSWRSAFEAPYVTAPVSRLTPDSMGTLPVLIKIPSQKNILLLEADTQDYPVMWIKSGEKHLEPHFWQLPDENENRRPPYNSGIIAKTVGTREFPWRIFAIARTDADLLTNQLVYQLAPKCRIKDVSWIKPGWVTFDWWAKLGLYGVDFKAGVNMATAKYMIDFASEFGIPYFMFDKGWTDDQSKDLTVPVSSLDMEEIVVYAKSKNVDIILWVATSLLNNQMEKALDQFSRWGIKGIKVDFINRSDQEAVNYYWRVAEACAKRSMMVNFHGAYRPDGLRRAYPNVLTREALVEFEMSGVSHKDNPDHHCTLPFIRNVAGPMDYIPGTVNNASIKEFAPIEPRPMGQGTRAHSMALAVLYESPMQMLPDAQSDYYREAECTRFLTQIPTEWDQIVTLASKIGDYVTLARRTGSTWYIAAITDWTPREQHLIFDFLDDNIEYEMTYIEDGPNADIRGTDYISGSRPVKKGYKINVSLAPGGGYVAKLVKKSKSSK